MIRKVVVLASRVLQCASKRNGFLLGLGGRLCVLSPGSFGAVLSRAVAVAFGCFYSEGGSLIKLVDVWSCSHGLGQVNSNSLIYLGERS